MPVLQLFLLGSLDMRYDGQQLPKPPTLKSQSLLAYLSLHRQQPQSRERLAGLFWGERSERRARRSLTTSLWHIRRCLPDERLLLGDVHTLQFDPGADLWLDVAEFEILSERPDVPSLLSAVELYRGDFMDGFYDDWVLNERYRLETLYTAALARLMASLETGGEYSGALGVAQRLLQHDPLREDAHRLAMRAYCRLGQRNAALEQYRRCQTIVKQELEAEPVAETSELYQAILDGRFELGPAVDRVIPGKFIEETPLRVSQNPLEALARNSLVGREAEMAFLQARFMEARAGRGGLALIHGEAGVGKTRLLEEFADYLGWQGVRVLWGRCYEFERILPYQPISEALQAVLASTPAADLVELPPWILGELSRLVPELAEKLPRLSAASSAPLDQEQAQLFEGVARFMDDLAAQGPLLLILDDLHWASESTLEMIHYLARRLANRAALILGALRPEAIGEEHVLTCLQRQLSREGLAQSLNLPRLSQASIEALVVEMSGDRESVAPLARRLYQETEGNPFFLIEIVKALFETGMVRLENEAWRGDFDHISRSELPLPLGLSEAIQARVHRLDEETRQALQAAAVLGREFDFDVLAATWRQSEQATLEAVDALLRRRFIREGSGILGRDYAFQHHKIQEVIYAAISLRRRQRLHACAGEALERLYASDLTAAAGELAFHFSQARQADATLTPKAIRYLLSSGDQARLAYAHREAIQYYSQALELQKEARQYEEAGRTLMKLGLAHHTNFDYAQARTAFEDGFIQWQRAGQKEPAAPLPAAPHPLRIRWRSPYTLDPAMCEEYVSSMVIHQLFRGLATTGPELELVPEVAGRWQVLDGGRRYRFHLRPEARWSDGAPLTASDFEYAWKRALDPASGVDANMLFVIKGGRAFNQGHSRDPDRVGVRALDDHTLEVELEEPASHFLYMLDDTGVYPLPRHVIARHGAAWTEVDKIVSNGPFKLEAWEPGECMRLGVNPFYSGPRKGNVEQVVLYFPRDLATQDLTIPLEQYVKGELDVLTLTDASVHEGDRIRRQFAAEYVSAPWLFTIYMGCVVKKPPFDDVRVRQALALGIDREELANVVLRGMYTPGVGGFIPPGMPGHSAHIGLAYDPGRAQQLLAEAGYEGGAGMPVLEALSVPPIDPLVNQFLLRQWQENLGIQATWEVLDWPPFSRRLIEAPPHVFNLARIATWPDPVRILGSDDSPLGYTHWTNPTYSELIQKASQSLDQEARLGLLRQADQILMHEAAIIPLFYGRQHVLVKPWVRSFPISALNRWYWQDAVIEAD